MQRINHRHCILNHRFVVECLDLFELAARGANGLEALAVHLRKIEFAVHGLVGENADASLFAFEFGEFVNAFNGRQGAVAIEEDEIVACPAGLVHRSVMCFQLRVTVRYG